jgi:hypothetical protein
MARETREKYIQTSSFGMKKETKEKGFSFLE